jgi:hypothetical protein
LNLLTAENISAMTKHFHRLLLLSFAVLIVSIIGQSCAKSNTTNPETLKTSLWPLKFGNTWVYTDSLFSDSALTTTYLDTAVILHQNFADPTGLLYFEISDPNGWFGTGNYLAVDPSNTMIYDYDSVNAGTYLLFGIPNQDGTIVGSGTDFTNPTCPLQENIYGFVSTVNVDGYTCYQNIEYNTDCHGVVQETIIIYVAVGAGVVRIEDYLANPNNNNTQYLQYSQTLVSEGLN